MTALPERLHVPVAKEEDSVEFLRQRIDSLEEELSSVRDRLADAEGEVDEAEGAAWRAEDAADAAREEAADKAQALDAILEALDIRRIDIDLALAHADAPEALRRLLRGTP